MGMFEMSDAQAVEWREKLVKLVEPHVHGEPVEAAAAFRRGGAAAGFAASKAQLGGLVYAGIKMFNKKRAGGLPDKIVLAATPTKIYAFNLGFKGRDYRIKGEAAVWDRAGLRISTDRRSGMTALTIESPDEDEKATLVGIGVKDDPVSLEMMGLLEGASPASAT
jgi:hypothetical protein